MKILVVHNKYKSKGGEDRAVLAQVKSLNSLGHRVLIYEKNNLEIDSYGVSEKAGFFPKTIFSLDTYNEIIKLIREYKPDIAHIHNVFPLISPSIYYALNNEKIPIVQTIHNFRFLCPNGLFYINDGVCDACKFGNTTFALIKKCFRESYLLSALYAFTIGGHRYVGTFELIDRFIALTEFSANILVENKITTRNKISVLGNFLPDPLPAIGNNNNREKYVVYIGRISKEKGVDVLIDAGSKIQDIKILILGIGPELDNLRQYSENLEIKNIRFLGQLEGERKWDILRRAAAVVIPSLCYENFPLTAIEGMSVGTPVIVSRIGSMPYIVQEGINGMLFEPGNSTELSEKIVELASEPNLRMKLGQFGIDLVKREYSEPIFTKKLINIYEDLIL